ncbi:MAG: hypothetical protein R3E04_07915 [Sphingobium sp.]
MSMLNGRTGSKNGRFAMNNHGRRWRDATGSIMQSLRSMVGLFALFATAGCVISDEPFISASEADYPLAERVFLMCSEEKECNYLFLKKVSGGYESYEWKKTDQVFKEESVTYRFRKFASRENDFYVGQQKEGSQYRLFLMISQDGGYRIYAPKCAKKDDELLEKLKDIGVSSECKIVPGAKPTEILGRWKSATGKALDPLFTLYPVNY